MSQIKRVEMADVKFRKGINLYLFIYLFISLCYYLHFFNNILIL